jgi:hypothetical protein
MNSLEPGAFGIGLVVMAFGLLQLAWYVGVIAMLVLIWRKVRHLPS